MTCAAPTFAVEPNLAPVPADERATQIAHPDFGRVFTDHMVTIQFSQTAGWYNPKVGPRQPLVLDPASSVLHYAQEIFEGLKAYRLPDGGTGLFRPDANARRFADSARRLAMAPLPEDLFLEAVRQLVLMDRDWVPSCEGGALYLRPFMIGTERYLGMKPSSEYLFLVIASPVGPLFKGGAPTISLWISDHYTRAAPGGTGAAKCGGNYAASLSSHQEALAQGCHQVLFLDAVERRWIEELGGMNIFFVFDDGSVRTPPLGTILPGITRDSVMTLAQDEGLTVHEQSYSIDECEADAKSGRLKEAFACGTAAVLTPIGRMRALTRDFTIGGGSIGPVSVKLRDRLVTIQRGEAPDPFGWTQRVF
jgi:branched-chain amino acid aminotransferase